MSNIASLMESNRLKIVIRVFAVVAIAGVLGACRPPAKSAPPAATPPPAGTVAVMGASSLNGAQLAAWYRSKGVSAGYLATESIDALAQYYVEEGAAEGVRGDLAFVQAVLETGWFRSVLTRQNNFAGIGATDVDPAPAAFPDARTGVRAQIQHLRAYADPTATVCAVVPLRNPCVDPRFHLVAPKGKAPTWNQMGNGNWASSTTYAVNILSLYNQARAYNGLAYL